MATIAYPHCTENPSVGGLPQLNVQYKGKVDSFVARTRMDTGEFRQRARYSRQLETVSATLILNHLELDFWRNWVMHTLAQGTLPFTIGLPLGGSGEQGGILIDREVRIVGGQWKHTYMDFLFHKISFSMEFIDTSTMDPDIFSVYTDLGDISDPCDQFDLVAFEAAVALAETGAATIDEYTRNILPVHINGS